MNKTYQHNNLIHQQQQQGAKEDFYLRQQLHQMSSDIQKNSFNLVKYTKTKKYQKKRNTLQTSYTQNSYERVSTDPNEQIFRIKDPVDLAKTSKGFNRIMNKNSSNQNKKMVLTGSLKYRTNAFSMDKFRSQSRVSKESEKKIEQLRKESFNKLEKVNNRGPFKQKMLETWLDSILLESVKFQILDDSLGNVGLKRFQIDQNSLLSKGIKPNNVSRIYGALFVHSIGFNNSLKQLTSYKNDALKNIWRVFSILVQYCAQGKFETVIGQLQRDSELKISELQQQIIQRQQIIEKNDELNQQKNIQIYKQVKQLREENINLKDQKEILYEDYQKVQQSFNEEVLLRLKFESKINQLFGIHRELGIKHQRLYEDYKKKVVEWNNTNQKNGKLIEENYTLKVTINDLTMENNKLSKNKKYNQQYINQLKKDKINLGDELNLFKRNYEDERRVNKEQKRRLTQYQIQLKNLTQIVQIKDKSWKETHSEYQLSLEENNRLYTVINEQRAQLQQLLFEKKQFNNKILGLMADASFEKKKKQQFQKLYYDADQKVSKLTRDLEDSDLAVSINLKNVKSLEEVLKVNSENIKEMHYKNQELQQEREYLTKFRDNIDGILEEKCRCIKEQEDRIINKDQQIISLKTLNAHLQVSIKNSNEASQSEITILRGIIDNLKGQRDELLMNGDEKTTRMIAMKQQIEKYTELYNKYFKDFKNERFQRINMKQNYDQSLSIIEKKNQVEKSLGRQLSEAKQRLLESTQEVNRLTLQLELQTTTRIKRQEKLQALSEQFMEHKKIKHGYIHPLIYEDLCQSFLITKQKLKNAETKIAQLLATIQKIQKQYSLQLTIKQQNSQKALLALQATKDKIIERKQSQAEYQKKKLEVAQKRLQKLEQLSQTYLQKIKERTNEEKQRVYNQLIQQKTKSIDELVSKLGLTNQKVSSLQSQINHKESQYQTEIIGLHQKYRQEINKKQEQVTQLKFDLEYVSKEKQKYAEQLKEQENKMEEKMRQQMQEYFMISRTQNRSVSVDQEPQKCKDKQGETKSKWNKMKKIENQNPEIKLRNEMARKIKITYKHYQH